MMPSWLTTDRTSPAAALACSVTIPPSACSVPVLDTEDANGWPSGPVTLPETASVITNWIKPSPRRSSVAALPEASAIDPSCA